MEKIILEDAYLRMKRIREFDLLVHDFSAQKELVMGIMHSHIGAEAYSAGVLMNLCPEDYVSTTYRCHAHAIARGIDLGKMAAEFCGRKTGVCGGMAGNMHCTDQDINIIAAFGIIGAGLPAACGAAFAEKYKKTDHLSCVFFGDGGVPQGAFHESMNIAAVWKLPVLFVNDNNRYAMSTCSSNNLVDEHTVTYARAYKMPAVTVDGMNFFEVYDAAQRAVEHIRAGKGPYYLECMAYRYHGQFEGDEQHYKIAGEPEYYWTKDPVAHFERTVLQLGWMTEGELEKLEEQVEREVAAAFQYASESPFPDKEDMFTHVYADSYEGGLL